MTCHSCRIDTVKAGKNQYGVQRHKCQKCGKRFTEPQAPRETPFGEDVRLSFDKVGMNLPPGLRQTVKTQFAVR